MLWALLANLHLLSMPSTWNCLRESSMVRALTRRRFALQWKAF